MGIGCACVGALIVLDKARYWYLVVSAVRGSGWTGSNGMVLGISTNRSI